MPVSDRLDDLRATPWRRRSIALTGVVVGLGLGAVHWIGFVLGGAIVGLVAPDPKRAVVAGLGFGLVVWLVFLAGTVLRGTLGAYAATGQVAVVTAAIPLLLGVLGSLARGLVR